MYPRGVLGESWNHKAPCLDAVVLPQPLGRVRASARLQTTPSDWLMGSQSWVRCRQRGTLTSRRTVLRSEKREEHHDISRALIYSPYMALRREILYESLKGDAPWTAFEEQERGRSGRRVSGKANPERLETRTPKIVIDVFYTADLTFCGCQSSRFRMVDEG